MPRALEGGGEGHRARSHREVDAAVPPKGLACVAATNEIASIVSGVAARHPKAGQDVPATKPQTPPAIDAMSILPQSVNWKLRRVAPIVGFLLITGYGGGKFPVPIDSGPLAAS